MQVRLASSAAVLAGIAATGVAQTASLSLVPSATTAAAGDTVSVDIVASYDLMGMNGAGVFGPAGFWGAAAELSLDSGMATFANAGVVAELEFLSVAEAASGVRLGGSVGFDDSLAPTTVTVGSFDVEIDAAATGSVTIAADSGAVILAIGDALVTASSDPGANQVQLDPIMPVTITLGQGPCSEADLAMPFQTLDFADVLTFLNAFSTSAASADLAPPMGTLDFADVLTFLNVFSSGCP